MILKQLTLSATRRNADVVCLAKLYSSPAVCQTLTTSKAPKRLSKDDRRALVESFVSDYRAANAGKFPSLDATHKEVGGSYYVVRKIFQELKLKPEPPLPIVAKALSDVSASVPKDASSESDEVDSKCESKLVITATHEKTETETAPNGDVDTKCDSITHLLESMAIVLEESSISSETDEKETLTETASSDEVDSKCQSNLLITATHEETEAETAPNGDVDSKCDSITHPPESEVIVLEESSKTSETDEKENLTQFGSQEFKADHTEGAAVSENVMSTETRLVPVKGAGEVKTGENSSAWSNIMSFAREFANFFRTR